jgi:hypothetical protein
MAIKDLVQVDDQLWIDPRTVTCLKHFPAATIAGLDKHLPDRTSIVCGDKCSTSYWPFERVQRALGLVDKTWIHEAWEATT